MTPGVIVMGDIVRRGTTWYVRYKDSDGTRRMRKSHQPTRELARRYLLEIEGRVARGNIGIPEPAPAALIKAPPPPPVVTEPPKGREPRPTWRLATGITAMGLGLGLVGFGLSGVLLEDQCVRPPMVLNGTCRVVYNSAPTGGGIMLGGVALTLAGVILVAIPGPRRK